MLQNHAMLEVIRKRPALLSGLTVFVALLLTTDDRFFGAIPDEIQMASSAVALSHFGEIGVSSNWAYVAHPREGEWFSRYGFLQSLVLVPSTLAARFLSVAAPALVSGPLFSLLQIFLLSAAALATSLAARSLGSSPGNAFASGVLLIFSTPLWAYSSAGYSEPLQTASLALSFAAAVAARNQAEQEPWKAFGRGIVIGLPLLAKSSLCIPVASFLLLTLLQDHPPEMPARKKRQGSSKGKSRRDPGTSSANTSPSPTGLLPAPGGPQGRARCPRSQAKGIPGSILWPRLLLAGFVLPCAMWAALEFHRFGKLLGGYEAEGFDYPFFTGLLRLTVFPNKGILFYAPLTLLAVPGLWLLFRRNRVVSLSLGIAILSPLVLAAGWWAWDGQAAWGPRLVLTALPFLFVPVAVGLSEAGLSEAGLSEAGLSNARGIARRAAILLAAAGIGVNSMGALQPFAGVYAAASSVPAAPIPLARAAGTPYEIEQGPDGTLYATAPHHLSLTPAWTPLRIHALFLLRRMSGTAPEEWLARGFALDPPFRATMPVQPKAVFRAAVSPFRWPFWGRSWLSPDGNAVDPYLDALFDQALRAAETKNWHRAGRLAQGTLSWPANRRSAFFLKVGEDAARAIGDLELAAKMEKAAPRSDSPSN